MSEEENKTAAEGARDGGRPPAAQNAEDNLTAAKAGNDGAGGTSRTERELDPSGEGVAETRGPAASARRPAESCLCKGEVEYSQALQIGDEISEAGRRDAKPVTATAGADPVPAKSSKKRDWAGEAYETFIKDAEGLDPTDPVKAVEAYFERNATDELKARCKAEGKDAKGCWEFIEAVARKVGGNCHIDPGAVYAIAMHWFEDVPVGWRDEGRGKRRMGNGEWGMGKREEGKGKREEKKAKAKKAKSRQGVLFELEG